MTLPSLTLEMPRMMTPLFRWPSNHTSQTRSITIPHEASSYIHEQPQCSQQDLCRDIHPRGEGSVAGGVAVYIMAVVRDFFFVSSRFLLPSNSRPSIHSLIRSSSLLRLSPLPHCLFPRPLPSLCFPISGVRRLSSASPLRLILLADSLSILYVLQFHSSANSH